MSLLQGTPHSQPPIHAKERGERRESNANRQGLRETEGGGNIAARSAGRATRSGGAGDQPIDCSREHSEPFAPFKIGINAQGQNGLPMSPGASQEISRDAYGQPFAFQFGSISPAFVNGNQGSQVQRRRYLHANGLPLHLANQRPISGTGSPVHYQQLQSPPFGASMRCSTPSPQTQLSGTPVRPPLYPSALHSQQVIMHRGQHLKLQRPMILHTSHGVPHNLNSVPVQIPMQQFPWMGHPMGPPLGTTFESKLPSGMHCAKFGPPVENKYRTCINRAVKITHPETHEELRFDSNSMKPELYEDGGGVTLFRCSTLSPGKTAANVSQATNFYPIHTGSFEHSSPVYYQPPKNPIPVGPLGPPPVMSNCVHSEQQLLVPLRSTQTSFHKGLNSGVSLKPDYDILKSAAIVPAEDICLPNTAVLSHSVPSSKDLSPVNSIIAGIQSGSFSVESETSTLRSDGTKSVVVSATSSIEGSRTCTSVSSKLTPAVDEVSSNSSVSASKAGSKSYGLESHKGESVKISGATSKENSRKRSKKKNLKTFATSKYDDLKDTQVISSEMFRRSSKKGLHSPQDLHMVSSVFASCSSDNLITVNETALQDSVNLNELKSLNAEVSVIGNVDIDHSKVENEHMEYPGLVDLEQITDIKNELDAGYTEFKMDKRAHIANLGNSSVTKSNTANKLPFTNRVLNPYKSQNNGIAHQLTSNVTASQERPLPAVVGQSTQWEACIEENDKGIGIDTRFRHSASSLISEVAKHDIEIPSESDTGSGKFTVMHEQLSIPTGSKMNKGAMKKVNVDSKDKPMNLAHIAKEKVENLPVITNQQSSLGSALKPTGSKKKRKKKKKKKEYLAKADAASSNGDLYNAYKIPEEKQESVNILDASKLVLAKEKSILKEFQKESQQELDDWDNAAEFQMENKMMEAPLSPKSMHVDVLKAKCVEDRKYTRDFLLRFKNQFRDLPAQFEIQADIAEQLFIPGGFTTDLGEMQTCSNDGSALDRQHSDRCQFVNIVEDKWIRTSGYFPSVRDIRVNLCTEGAAGGFRPGQSTNPGLIRNVNGSLMNPFITASFPGRPLTQMPLDNFAKTSYDADRWQRASISFRKGLFSSPRNKLSAMHKAEKKYEIGKVSDEEDSKQRQIKGILNKLTPQNFDKLFSQVKEVNIDSALTLTGVISQIFDKALMEPTFCEMYAKFCVDLASDLPEFYEDSEKITFKRVLLNKCQEEFERGEREQAEADKLDQDGKVKVSNGDREQKRIKARRRMLGNIRFIGELYKKSMLTERIMHECIKKLLGESYNPDEEDVEALCKLMSTIGQMIDRSKAREHIDTYFDKMINMSNNQQLPSRLRFMLKDVIDLRKNGWQQRRKVEGPKKIEEVHRDAVQERKAQIGRTNRGSGMGSSGRRLTAPPDYASRGLGSMFSSSRQPMLSAQKIRGAQSHMGSRGHGRQDVRLDSRIVSGKRSKIPLAHRASEDVTLTAGPQGGLTRGMIHKEHSVLLRQSALDVQLPLSIGNKQENSGQSLHMGSEEMLAMDEHLTKYFSVTRTSNSFEQSLLEKPSIHEKDSAVILGRSLRREEFSVTKSEVASINGIKLQDISPERMPVVVQQLRKMSEMTIKEYYSVRDMNEAASCVENLKAAWFHADMVSQWVIDSFDRKDVERDLLADLLVHLYKTKPYLLNHGQLIRGMEISLCSLEDTIVDAPKATMFIGGILGKFVLAETLSLAECAKIIKKGGIEQGSLLEAGLALDVISSVLDVIKRERGEAAMTDMYEETGFQVEDFMPSEKNHQKLEFFLEKENIECLYPLNLNPIQKGISTLLMHRQPLEEILKLVEVNVQPSVQSESEFLKMLIFQVLRCYVPYPIPDYEKHLKRKLVPYASLLRQLAATKQEQRHYIAAIQLFANELHHPAGLMTSLFNNFYVNEVISKEAYFSWQNDIEDITPGRKQAIQEVGKWLSWLAQATEAEQ